MTDHREVVRTLSGPHTFEGEKVRGSRFVADAAPCTTADEATVLVEAIRKRHPDASHHCWAWRLASGRERSSDDGEPAGTAGAPILRRIGGADVVDVVVVVSRWFGGTKLGTGGLVRAYGAAAGAVLADAPIVERQVTSTLALSHDYELQGVVDGLLSEHDATVLTSDYGARVDLVVTVPRAAADAFVEALRERTSGRVEAEARA